MTKSKSKVFLAYDEDMMLHRPNIVTEDVDDPDFVHERPSRLRAAHDALVNLENRLLTQQYLDENMPNDLDAMQPLGFHHRFVPLACHPASREAICRVHSQEHFDFMERTSTMSPKGLDRLTKKSRDLYYCEDTFYAARLAVGGCIHAVNAVTSPFSLSRRAICLVRPPAHHATRDAAMGFCYFNSIVIAAQHALHTGRARKVFILDWDVHHGNGIQDLTYDDPNVFYLSIHRASSATQWFYPDTGRAEETGSGCGVGTNANIALEQGGMGNKEYAVAFCELVLPAMEDFAPDLILIACGADAAKGDLLGDCGLTSDMYYVLTKSVMEAAGLDIPLIAVLEGGYNLPVLADCLQAVAIAMLDEPFDGTFVSSQSRQAETPASHHEEKIEPNEITNDSDNDSQCLLSRFWSHTEKAELQMVRTNHPKKGVTKQALAAVKRTAHALAVSQHQHQASYQTCILGSPEFSGATDTSKVLGFRRLRLLDSDRCPGRIVSVKRLRRKHAYSPSSSSQQIN